MPQSQLIPLIVVGFPLFFITLWLFVMAILSTLGGWRSLAGRFPAVPAPAAQRFTWVTASLRRHLIPVGYRNCMNVQLGDHGITLSVPWPFRFMHPPLTLPWSQVEGCEQKLSPLWTRVQLRVRDGGTILFTGRAGTAVLEAWQARGAAAAVPQTTPSWNA